MSTYNGIKSAFNARMKYRLNRDKERQRYKKWRSGLSPEKRKRIFNQVDQKKVNAYKRIYNKTPKHKFYVYCGSFLLSDNALLKFAQDQNPELFSDVQDVNQNLLLFEEK